MVCLIQPKVGGCFYRKISLLGT